MEEDFVNDDQSDSGSVAGMTDNGTIANYTAPHLDDCTTSDSIKAVYRVHVPLLHIVVCRKKGTQLRHIRDKISKLDTPPLVAQALREFLEEVEVCLGSARQHFRN